MRRPAATAAALVLAVLLVGCGGDDGEGPGTTGTSQRSDDPTGTPSEEPTGASSEPDGEGEAAGAPCTTVSDEQLTRIAGSEQRVTGPREEGTSQRCATTRDVDDSLEVTWTLHEPDMSFAELVEYESDPELEQERLKVAGAPAVLMSGEYVGEQLARVLVEVDAGLLVVEAKNSAAGGEPRPEAELARVATEIAAAYVS